MIKPETREALEQLILRLTDECRTLDPNRILKILYESLGGMRLTIPTLKEIEIEARNRRIRMKFNGSNYVELSQMFGINERHVRRIVKTLPKII